MAAVRVRAGRNPSVCCPCAPESVGLAALVWGRGKQRREVEELGQDLHELGESAGQRRGEQAVAGDGANEERPAAGAPSRWRELKRKFVGREVEDDRVRLFYF